MNSSTYSKEKKTTSNSKIKIYNESLSREKKSIYIGKKKEKANLVTKIEKNQLMRNRLVIRKKKHQKLLLSYKFKEVLNTK